MYKTIVLIVDLVDPDVIQQEVMSAVRSYLKLDSVDELNLIYNYPTESYCIKYGLSSELETSVGLLTLSGRFNTSINFFDEGISTQESYDKLLSYIQPIRSEVVVIGIVYKDGNSTPNLMIRDLITKDFTTIEITI